MNNRISNRLKILIDLLGLKNKDFSKHTGVPYTTLLDYLAGRVLPGSESLQKICTTYRINLNWLLTGEGEMFIGKQKPIDMKDIPIYNIKEWLDEFWSKASEDEKAWLKVQFPIAFPQYKEWLLKKEASESRDTTIPKADAA